MATLSAPAVAVGEAGWKGMTLAGWAEDAGASEPAAEAQGEVATEAGAEGVEEEEVGEEAWEKVVGLAAAEVVGLAAAGLAAAVLVVVETVAAAWEAVG